MHTEDRGLLYAEACFETFRVLDGAIFNWTAHEDRLRLGLSLFGLDLPGGLEKRCLVEANSVAADALVRVTVTGGNAPRGLMLIECERNVGVYIQTWSYTQGTEETHLRTVEWPWLLSSRVAKFTADYAQTIRGLLDLRNKNLLGKNEEALICDSHQIYSAPTSNIMLFVDGAWLTPSSDAVVPGVVRHALLDADVVHACPCPRSLTDRCEAIVLTNSGWFIRPVASIDGRKLHVDGAYFHTLYSVLIGQTGVPVRFLCG